MDGIGRHQIVLAILVLLVIGLAVVAQPDYGRPNLEFMPAMRRSPSYEAYEPHPELSGGTTMQPPVAGTVPRGGVVFPYGATPEDAVRAGEEWSSPIPEDSEARRRSVERGRQLFAIYCRPCHGPGGEADGPVVRRGYPPPPSLLSGKSVQMKDGQLFHILTYGQGNMASMAGPLSVADRWDVIHFVRSLQAQARSAVASQPTSKTGKPSKTAKEPPPAKERQARPQEQEQKPSRQSKQSKQSKQLERIEPKRQATNQEAGAGHERDKHKDKRKRRKP